MRFFFAKKDHICLHCRTEIKRGEPFTRLGISSRNGTGQVGLLFHIECFPVWNEANFVRRFLTWRDNQIPPKKRGRPLVPTTDRKKRRQLLSLLTYHKKAGNIDRVREIENKIKELEV